MGMLTRIWERGIGWFLRRSFKELYAPTTGFGCALRKVSKPAVRLFGNVLRDRENHSGWMVDNETLYAFYDLEVEPITFDFATFLVLVDCRRQLLGLHRLYVVFVPGRNEGGLREEDPAYEKVVGLSQKRWRITNLLVPITALVPSCCGYTMCETRHQARAFETAKYKFADDYAVAFPVYTSFADWRGYFDQGADLGVFEAPREAVSYIRSWLSARADGRPLVTITLRHYEFMTDRNSNLQSWAEVASELDKQKYFVVIVPDLDQAVGGLPEEFSEFVDFSEACWNLSLRMALYQEAFQNFFVNSGPASLCYFSKVNYLMFKIITESVPQATEESIRRRNLVPGENPPFAGVNQKWVWEDDQAEVIRSEFRKMETRMGG